MDDKTIEIFLKNKTYNSLTFEWIVKSKLIPKPYFVLEIYDKIYKWKLIYTGYRNSFTVSKLEPGPGSVFKFRLGVYDGELKELHEQIENNNWRRTFKACTSNHPFTVAQLNKAIVKDNIQFIKEIIKTRPSILETEDSNTHTPIVKAVLCNNLPVITHLVNAGIVDINSPNILTGRTTLMIAVTNKFIKIIKYLIEHKVDVNNQDINGCTATHYAIDVNNLTILNILLEKRADVTIPDRFGYTPLIRSIIMAADYQITEKLFKKWNDGIKIKDTNNLTCIDHANLNNREDLIKLFTESKM